MNITRALAGVLLLSLVSTVTPALAEPEQGEVRAGAATIEQVTGTTTIRQLSDRAVIDWQRFSIGRGELVRFVQPSETAAILNRVVGSDPSRGPVPGRPKVASGQRLPRLLLQAVGALEKLHQRSQIRSASTTGGAASEACPAYGALGAHAVST